MTNETILNRIEKLLALATSSNPNEAASALNKAQALMAEHNLSEGMLERNKIGEAEVKSTQSVSKVKDWESLLVGLIGQSFGCRMMWRSGHSLDRDPFGRFILVGPKVNLQLAEYAATFLLRQIVDGRRKYNQTLTGYPRDAKTRLLDGFCKGYIAALRPKISKFANPEGIEKAIDDHINDNAKGEAVDVQRRVINNRGLLAGAAAGSDVDLNRPMAGPDEQLKLGGR